jgi:hypothetical protein
LISRGHIQRSLQLGRGALHWAALAAISNLMVPLLLSFFPPTMGLPLICASRCCWPCSSSGMVCSMWCPT